MPRKPVKLGFKIWCCLCSCCGYLCRFQVYHGASRDLVTGRKVPERGLAKRVVGNLVAPFVELIMCSTVIIFILADISLTLWPGIEYYLSVLLKRMPKAFQLC